MKFEIDINDNKTVHIDKKNNIVVKNKKNVVDNSKIDYAIFNNFDFAPELLSEDETILTYKMIEKTQESILNANTLKQIAQNFKKIHNSKLKFVPFNLIQKLKLYRQKIRDKRLHVEVLEKYFKRANKILRNMKKTTPIHNDVWPNNILINQNKVYFIDWELATMGDKHYDLAFFIESAQLTDEQETKFLEYYDDDYIYEYIIQSRILVNYVTVAWLNALYKKRFDDQPLIHRIETLINYYHEKFVVKQKK